MTTKLDQDLIELTLSGELSAFEKLVGKYQNMVFSIAIKLVGNTKDAEDVTQDTFLNAYKSLSSFRGKSKFSSWLYRIGYNKGLDALAKRKSYPITYESTLDSDLNMVTIEDNWNSFESKERRLVIKKSIDSLQGDDGIIITLFYYEELSLKEISHVLGVKSDTVKVKLHRARKKLEETLRKTLEPEIIKQYEK